MFFVTTKCSDSFIRPMIAIRSFFLETVSPMVESAEVVL